MSKTSTVSARQTPPQDGTVAAGGLVIHAETVVIDTADRVEFVDLTERLIGVVRASGVREGLVSVWSLHTTCAVFINENQQALHADIVPSSSRRSRATASGCTTIRSTPIATATTPTRTCARCSSATA